MGRLERFSCIFEGIFKGNFLFVYTLSVHTVVEKTLMINGKKCGFWQKCIWATPIGSQAIFKGSTVCSDRGCSMRIIWWRNILFLKLRIAWFAKMIFLTTVSIFVRIFLFILIAIFIPVYCQSRLTLRQPYIKWWRVVWWHSRLGLIIT